ncbi:MAG: hypothetical protein ABFD07_17565 [Methanobacterium sp.]
MPTIDDYTSGKVLKNVKLTIYSLKLVKIPVLGQHIRKELLKKIIVSEPKLIDIKIASSLIHESKKCAVGERVCRAINKDSKLTESVFLDELAEGMINVRKARYVQKEEAIKTLKKYPKNPLILAKVSNKYMEICRSYPEDCVYYNMHRCKIKCLTKYNKL